jgi:hypothetical protein
MEFQKLKIYPNPSGEEDSHKAPQTENAQEQREGWNYTKILQ